MSFNNFKTGLFTAILLSTFSSGIFAAGNEGAVTFAMRTGSWFDVYTNNPTATQQAWLRDNVWRMQVTSSYFDTRLSWYPNAWVYIDLYGIPTNSALVGSHPDWILKDGNGNFLYIPFDCNGSVCTQYALDPGNASVRSWWINAASGFLKKGYKGIWIDDVNLSFRVGNGAGKQVAPFDPRTGTTMTILGWEKYVADFTKAIRGAFPTTEIAHNSIWFAGVNSGTTTDPYVAEQIAQADYIVLERGVSDTGLKGGTGFWSFNNLLTFVDHVHAMGKHVIFDEYTRNGEYGLAGYLLTSNGGDAEVDQSMTPNNWWAGYDVDLGTAQGARYNWNGLVRRNFTSGIVLANPPQAPTITVTLPYSMTRIGGSSVSSVTLSAGQGAVLIGAAPLPEASIHIDAGGAAAGAFTADAYYSGGYAGVLTNTVSTTGVTNPAPAAVYQSERWGVFTYTIPNLNLKQKYTVRLHFAEIHFTAAKQRVFNVDINGTCVLPKFDIIVAAGGANKAIVKQFTAAPNVNGALVISFSTGGASSPKISGIEVQ